MTIRSLTAALACLAVLEVATLRAADSKPAEHPNIVLIVADDK